MTRHVPGTFAQIGEAEQIDEAGRGGFARLAPGSEKLAPRRLVAFRAPGGKASQEERRGHERGGIAQEGRVATDQRALRRGILWAFCAILVCYLGFAVSPGLFVAAGFLAVANAGGSILWTYGAALLQQIVPDPVRGRVAATNMGGMTLAMSASTFLVGFLLDRGISPRALMAGCGLVAAAPIAFWVAVQPAFARDTGEDGR